MFGVGVECFSVYTAAVLNAANRVCSANPMRNFVYKTNYRNLKNRREELTIYFSFYVLHCL